MIAELDDVYKRYFEARKKRCEYFTASSGGALRVRMLESRDTSDFKNNLLRVKKGSRLRDEEMDSIAKNIILGDFVTHLLTYEAKGHQKGDVISRLAAQAKVTEDTIEKLFQHLLNENEYEEILSLQYNSMPEDVLSIEYKVNNDYKLLNELLVGQKAVTLLLMALSDGVFPIVIDKP